MDAIAMFYNFEAERMVLGSVLLEPDLINDLIIKPEHFSDPKHIKLFKWMRELQRKEIPIDLVAIAEIAKERVNEVGGISYLSDMMISVPTTANIKFYEGIVIDNWKRREKYKVYQKALTNLDDDEIDAKIRQEIEEIENTGRRRKRFSIREHLIDKYSRMENMKRGLVGAETGFNDLDIMLEGLEKKKLIIVPARPSVGKTAFALNIVNNTIERSLGKDEEVFATIFSLEMGEDQLTNRMISCLGNIDGRKVKNPIEYFDDEDWTKYSHALSVMSQWEENLDICDESTITVEEIRARVRENMKDYPDKHHIVVIDYLQLIKPSRNYQGNRNLEISEISRALKNMANDLNCTVIALSQLSREVEKRQDKRPMLSDIRDSGSIEQDADIVIFLYRDDYYDKDTENKNIIELIIAKNREGSTGTVQLAYIKEWNKFLNLERRFGEAS